MRSVTAGVNGLGTLGFEMSVGQTQLIVNPGQMMTDPTMRRIMASTAAHSTLGLDNQNSPARVRAAWPAFRASSGEADGGILAVANMTVLMLLTGCCTTANST